MTDTPEQSPREDSPREETSPPPLPAPPPGVSRLPDSPVERAKLEAEGRIPQNNELQDRSTMVAFGLLFVVPLLIIVFSVLLLLPFINSQLTQDPDPGGATVQTSPNQLPPSR